MATLLTRTTLFYEYYNVLRSLILLGTDSPGQPNRQHENDNPLDSTTPEDTVHRRSQPEISHRGPCCALETATHFVQSPNNSI